MRVRSWARELAPREVAALERGAFAAAGALGERLDQLVASADRSAEAERVVAARDGLESLLCVLAYARAGRKLATRLAALDRQAASLGSIWVEASIAAHPRWYAVRAAEPDAWWVELVDDEGAGPEGDA